MRLKITWAKSAIGYPDDQRDTVRALGFHKLWESKVVEDIPQIRGMINKVRHLLKVEEIS